jgi:hypothetical protein
MRCCPPPSLPCHLLPSLHPRYPSWLSHPFLSTLLAHTSISVDRFSLDYLYLVSLLTHLSASVLCFSFYSLIHTRYSIRFPGDSRARRFQGGDGRVDSHGPIREGRLLRRHQGRVRRCPPLFPPSRQALPHGPASSYPHSLLPPLPYRSTWATNFVVMSTSHPYMVVSTRLHLLTAHGQTRQAFIAPSSRRPFTLLRRWRIDRHSKLPVMSSPLRLLVSAVINTQV